MPTLAPTDLRPYKSFVVARPEGDGQLEGIDLVRAVAGALKIARSGPRQERQVGEDGDGNAFMHYVEKRDVPWSGVAIVDTINHLLAVVHDEDGYVAIATTESGRRGAILRALRRGTLTGWRPASPARLKAAFVRGPTRTIWLKGTHRRNSVKADGKVLSGLDLNDALDPLGDQTYRYSAARCQLDDESIGSVIGLAVDDSRVWVGSSNGWVDFVEGCRAVLSAVAAADEAAPEPMPVVATSVLSLDGVADAFDVAVTPPELSGPVVLADAEEVARLRRLEEIAYGTRFAVTPGDGADFVADLEDAEGPLGRVEVSLAIASDRIAADVARTVEPGREETFDEIVDALEDLEALTVYYDSGHALVDGQVYAMRNRPYPFTGWRWADFTDYAIDREKPENALSDIGSDTSLFDWVYKTWPDVPGVGGSRGWLLCDDRPGETADFVHLDLDPPDGGAPFLTLIHAKGAHGAGAGRGIAVTAYEVVSAQAVKNLRHLDSRGLAEGLDVGVPAGAESLAWEDGDPRTRDEFISVVAGLGADVRRRVVVLQPHVLRSYHDTVRNGGGGDQALNRLRQLDTMLLGAAVNCHGMGAEFLVVSDGA